MKNNVNIHETVFYTAVFNINSTLASSVQKQIFAIDLIQYNIKKKKLHFIIYQVNSG